MKLTNNLYFYPEQGMLDCNTYVIKGSPGIMVDPGSAEFLPLLLEGLRRDGIDPGSIGTIVNTHLHIDHCSANGAFRKLSGAEILLHPVQKKYYRLVMDGTRIFGLEPAEFKEDACLDDDRLVAGNTELELIRSPGHSPDCVCFYYREEKALVCGDVIFNQNTGRVDLPGGSPDELKKSIENLSRLEIEYLLPGHMDVVAGVEKVSRNFDFIRESVLKWL
jgi:glyoxylase-like metal-dependent hydrolase (beta-lactamase superfamily II)